MDAPLGATRADDVDNFETILVVMSALALSGLAVMGLVGWILHGAVESEAEEVKKRLEGLALKGDDLVHRADTLATELRKARGDVARLHALVGALRGDFDGFVQGPPSLRSPGIPANPPQESA